MLRSRVGARQVQVLVIVVLFMGGTFFSLRYVDFRLTSHPPQSSQISSNELEQVENLRQNFLIPPPNPPVKFPATNLTYYSQIEQDKIIDRLLNGTTNGFFLEAGAYDGEALSNTLFFERHRQWTGLLIEANPNLFRKLKSRNRNAYLSNTCISTVPYATKLNFTFADYLGGLEETKDKFLISGSDLVQCFPINTYLQALNINQINYFSLDVEGAEYEILKQIDFHRIKIDVMTIEYAIKYHGSPESLANLEKMRTLILGTGLYHEVMNIKQLDIVFMRNSS